MTTAHLHLQHHPLPSLADLHNTAPWLQDLVNLLDETVQVFSGALHSIPTSAPELNPQLRRDLGL